MRRYKSDVSFSQVSKVESSQWKKLLKLHPPRCLSYHYQSSCFLVWSRYMKITKIWSIRSWFKKQEIFQHQVFFFNDVPRRYEYSVMQSNTPSIMWGQQHYYGILTDRVFWILFLESQTSPTSATQTISCGVILPICFNCSWQIIFYHECPLLFCICDWHSIHSAPDGIIDEWGRNPKRANWRRGFDPCWPVYVKLCT